MESGEAELIGRSAPLHDVGKIGIPDQILLKPGTLTPDEFEVMKQHTTIGAELLSGGHSLVMQTAEIIALNHHERWGGAGYPAGRTGEQIPRSARIVALADVLAAIQAGIGQHFEPALGETFLRLPHTSLL